MTRAFRKWHLVAWAVVGPVAAGGLALAVAARPAPPIPPGAPVVTPPSTAPVPRATRPEVP